MLIALDARCRGSEHIKTDKPLQDFSGSTTDRWKSYAYALVADGHGGERYFRSEVGSHHAVVYAVESMNKVLRELVFYIKKKEIEVIDKTLKNLCSRIILLWREKVSEHFKANPLTEAETALCEKLKIALPISDDDIFTLYGSTLLCAVYFEKLDFWFALQIGDGKCVGIKTDGTVFYPIPDDEEQGFGVTKSLCGKNAVENFRYAYGFEKIAGIAVMSDGLTDSFDSEKLPDFLLNIKENAVTDAEKTKAELAEFLPKLSKQGSGDDISIAGIFVKEEEKNLLNTLRGLI